MNDVENARREAVAEALARAAGWSSVAQMVETCGFPQWFHNKADDLERELHVAGYEIRLVSA